VEGSESGWAVTYGLPGNRDHWSFQFEAFLKQLSVQSWHDAAQAASNVDDSQASINHHIEGKRVEEDSRRNRQRVSQCLLLLFERGIIKMKSENDGMHVFDLVFTYQFHTNVRIVQLRREPLQPRKVSLVNMYVYMNLLLSKLTILPTSLIWPFT
jgi:hypothetical protein